MIAVTGATGFIGGHLVSQLLAAGHDVRVLVRDRTRLPAAQAGEVDAVEVDLVDPDAMRSALAGCDVLYHLAGLVAGGPREVLWSVNCDAARVAVEAAAAAGLGRVVATSTITAIGPPERGQVADERTPYRSRGFRYLDSKHDGELAALEAGARVAIDVVVASPGYSLGAPIDRTMVKAPSARVISNYLRGRMPMVIDSVTNFVDVQDVAAGHLLAAEHGRPGERYLLGGVNLRWPELLERVRERSDVDYRPLPMPTWVAERMPGPTFMGRDVSGLIESIRLMAYDWAYSSDKARRELGYAPRPIDESIDRAIDWHRELAAAGRFDGDPPKSVDRAGAVVSRLRRRTSRPLTRT